MDRFFERVAALVDLQFSGCLCSSVEENQEENQVENHEENNAENQEEDLEENPEGKNPEENL